MTTLEVLRTGVRGRVLIGGDDGFEQASRPWNLAVEQPVAAVAEPEDAEDVATLVRLARTAGLSVAAQPGGHGATGNTAGAVLLRTSRLNQVDIQPGTQTARVGAGVQWGEVQAAAARFGLTGLAGSSPVVSVVGYTLGGGLGWFGRRYGWAAGSVRGFEIVDADGAKTTVTADSDDDLFWALRGGGGDFAVVTAVEFDLHPAAAVYGGRMLWPASRSRAVLEVFQHVTAEAPAELTLWFNLLQFPGSPPLVAVDATYLGQAEQAGRLLRPFDHLSGLLSDSRAPMSSAGLPAITAEPTEPGPGVGRAGTLKRLDDTIADALLAEPIDPLLTVQVRHLGAALRDDAGATSGISEPYLLYTLGIAGSPEAASAVTAKQRDLARSLDGYLNPRRPLTFLGPGDDVADAFPPAVLSRLQEIKRARDPEGVFRSNHPVLASG